MENMEYRDCAYNGSKKLNMLGSRKAKEMISKVIMGLALILMWQLTAMHYDNQLIMPYPAVTLKALFRCVIDMETMGNIMITMNRVLKGFVYALAIGVPLGLFMGSFDLANKLIGGLVDSVRQVPIMAWVPLTIVWFGIGDGPTIFIIAFSGVFPIILNTIHGVRSIPKDYYNAARSMGAGRISIFFNIMLPGSIPDILTGARIAISSGWMSVI